MRGNLLLIRLYLLPALAACLIVAACGTGEATQLREGADYHVGKGSGQTFHLPDGTVMVASPETTITLSKGYCKSNREIHLDGEARFDVTAKPNWPMVIRTRDLVIEVLGTRFKVNAYRDKPGEEVDVLTGSLRVRKSYHSDTDNEPEVLKDGDMVMINHDIDLMEKEALSPAELEKLKGLW
jgi:transmembrane sensor